MIDRSMRSGMELAQDIQLTDWSRAREHVKNLSNQFSGVQISCDICTRLGRYLYSTKQCWIINLNPLLALYCNAFDISVWDKEYIETTFHKVTHF